MRQKKVYNGILFKEKYCSERIFLHFNFRIFSINLFDTGTPFRVQIKLKNIISGNKLVFLNTRLKFVWVEDPVKNDEPIFIYLLVSIITCNFY